MAHMASEMDLKGEELRGAKDEAGCEERTVQGAKRRRLQTATCARSEVTNRCEYFAFLARRLLASSLLSRLVASLSLYFEYPGDERSE